MQTLQILVDLMGIITRNYYALSYKQAMISLQGMADKSFF